MKQPALLFWSSGKDSAWALHRLRQDELYEIVALLTTTHDDERVSMHGVRTELARSQARATGVPLIEVQIPQPCPNHEYEHLVNAVLRDARRQGVHTVAFGDLYLVDIRRYRERQLEPLGLKPLFPLWNLDTARLARDMIDGGLRALVSCLDPKVVPRELAGAPFDHAMLDRLPPCVDPCGEFGEFHTFATGGPMFKEPIPVELGELFEQNGFVYRDLLPAR